MERRDWIVLLPSLALALVFLISSSITHWTWQSRWDKESSRVATSSKAMAVLNRQEVELLAELNNPLSSITNTKFAKQQLTVNKELQSLLMQSHGNASEKAILAACARKRRGAELSGEGIQWRPKADRYLLMICQTGQVTNHLICFRKHMWFAALLNRTLVLPHGKLDYKYEHLLDMAHLKKCLGNSSVITFEEFAELRNETLHVDRLICYMHSCHFDKDHPRAWEALGYTFGERQDAWSSSSNPPAAHKDDILSRFACNAKVLAVGDLFYAAVEDSHGFAVAHDCTVSPVLPNRNIVVTAERFVQTYLGPNFLSLHFRRHGFLVFCNKQKSPSCFYPIPQAARCIRRKVWEARADVVYLSTDAPASEVDILKQELAGVTVVRRTKVHEAEAKWDSLLWRNGLESELAVMAMVDKTICVLGVGFMGTRESTFSYDILRMRNEMRTASSCDGFICDGETPSFLAQAP